MSGPARPIVALVDDDERVLESLGDLLESAGYDARAFTSARAFLDSETLRVADCLVSDLRMPEVDGSELESLASAARPELPVIFVTGQDAAGTTACLPSSAAARPLFHKPFDGQALLAEIRLALDAA